MLSGVEKFESCFLFLSLSGGIRGLLTVWDSTEVEVWSSVIQEHMLIIHGRFIRTNEEFHLFNVYAPCDLQGKQQLRASLMA